MTYPGPPTISALAPRTGPVDGGTLLAIRQHEGACGASLSWLSQYPHEKEVTFPALTALDVRDSHVEGSTIVVDMQPRLVDENEHAMKPAAGPKSSVCVIL